MMRMPRQSKQCEERERAIRIPGVFIRHASTATREPPVLDVVHQLKQGDRHARLKHECDQGEPAEHEPESACDHRLADHSLQYAVAEHRWRIPARSRTDAVPFKLPGASELRGHGAQEILV